MATFKLFATAQSCTKCALHQERTTVVYGTGSPEASIMLIGEGPGEQEDLRGEPFVGPSGYLLTRLLEKAGVTRKEVYITNMVKCGTPGNRDPRPEEMRACRPYLSEQITVIGPKVIITIGRVATCSITHCYGSMGALLEKDDLLYGTIPIVPIYHPAFLLRLGRNDRSRRFFQDTLDRIRRAVALAV